MSRPPDGWLNRYATSDTKRSRVKKCRCGNYPLPNSRLCSDCRDIALLAQNKKRAQRKREKKLRQRLVQPIVVINRVEG